MLMDYNRVIQSFFFLFAAVNINSISRRISPHSSVLDCVTLNSPQSYFKSCKMLLGLIIELTPQPFSHPEPTNNKPTPFFCPGSKPKSIVVSWMVVVLAFLAVLFCMNPIMNYL